MEQQEQINPYQYTYKGETIGIDGDSLLIFMKVLEQVVNQETKMFANYTYPSKVREILDDQGNVIRVEFEDVKEHNPTSFHLTATSENGGQTGLTALGLQAAQVLSALFNMHQSNIKDGLAIKIENDVKS